MQERVPDILTTNYSKKNYTPARFDISTEELVADPLQSFCKCNLKRTILYQFSDLAFLCRTPEEVPGATYYPKDCKDLPKQYI